MLCVVKQQKIRRDRERREERRMGGKQQVTLRGQRDRYNIHTVACTCTCICHNGSVVYVVNRERQRKRKKKWGNFNRYEKNQVVIKITCTCR